MSSYQSREQCIPGGRNLSWKNMTKHSLHTLKHNEFQDLGVHVYTFMSTRRRKMTNYVLGVAMTNHEATSHL